MSINLENVVLASPEQMEFIIEGMRNPMNSWEKKIQEKDVNRSDQSITEKRFTRPFPWIKEDDVYCNNCEHFHDCLNKGGLVDVTTGNDITKDRYINKPGYDCPKGEEHE